MDLFKKIRVTLIFAVLCTLFTFKFYWVVLSAIQKGISLETMTIGVVPALGLKQDPILFLSSLFYHAGFAHLFSNLMCLMVVGTFIEVTQGPKKLLFVALGSGLIGNFLLLLLKRSDHQSYVGFSGALMGMMVYFLICANREGRERRGKKFDWLVWTAFILFVLPNLLGFFDELKGQYTRVSHLSHLLGGIGGIILYDLLENNPKSKKNLEAKNIHSKVTVMTRKRIVRIETRGGEASPGRAH